MKTTDIIRDVLDLIDNIECKQNEPAINTPTIDTSENPLKGLFSNIFSQLSSPEYNNSPDARVFDVKTVTVDAGGGMNGPKQPSDLRGDSISLYPNYQHIPN